MSTKHWRIGGVQLELHENDTFSIYQPEQNRVLSKDLARQVADAIWQAYPALREELDAVLTENRDSPPAGGTVPQGVISTSEGPVKSEPAPKPAAKRGRPRKSG